MEKVYADKKGRAVFQCPHCGFKNEFDASGLRNKDSRIRVKCKCGESVPTLVEFREYYRRNVTLSGWCHVHRSGALLEMHVRDLSMSGLSFSLDSPPEGEDATLVVGDIVTIQFRLDCPPQNLLQRRAEIRNIRNGSVGAQFSKSEYDKELGFYLLR